MTMTKKSNNLLSLLMMGAVGLLLPSTLFVISSIGSVNNVVNAQDHALVAAANFPRPRGVEPSPHEYTIELPDGGKIKAKLQGGEENVEEVDSDGYVILGTGPSLTDYEYAVVDEETEDLVPSGVKVGDRGRRNKDPRIRQGLQRGPRAIQNMKLGGQGPLYIQKLPGRGRGTGGRGRTGTGVGRGRGVSGGNTGFGAVIVKGGGKDPPKNLIENEDEDDSDEYYDDDDDYYYDDDDEAELEKEERRRRKLVTWTGTKKNLVIPMRFSDHSSRNLPTKSQMTTLMNDDSGSVKRVFLDSSYGQLNLVSTVVDWVPLPKTEAYYADGNRGFTTTVHEAMEDALNYLQANNLVNFQDFDSDNDGYIDAICFLHSGYGAEWGGTSADGANYMNRIWSHKWALYSLSGGKWTSNSGVSVYNYHISPGIWGTSGTNIGRIGVIAHETGHFLGITDLYDSDGGGSGIGSWGLMANSWGFDGSQNCPPTMGPWSKIKLNWLTPRVVTNTGIYTLKMSYHHADVIKIQAKFPSSEYLLIEYRKSTGIESCMPTAGLAIWHIDDKAGYATEGYPGQSGWPGNGNHYRIALLQADGNYNLEKGNNRGDSLDLYTSSKTLGPNTVPNSDSYQGGNIVKTGIVIDQIGSTSGDTISFRITIPGTSPVAAPVPAPVPVPQPVPVPVPVPQPVPVPSPVAAPVPTDGACTDLFLPDQVWRDSDTTGVYGCAWYASGSTYCVQYGTSYANCNFRHPETNVCTTAEMVCCACGGGQKAEDPAPAPVPVPSPVAAPVPTGGGGGSWKEIDFNDFESGYGIWQRSDTGNVKIRTHSITFSGSYILMVKNKFNAYTDPIDTTSYDKLRVDFSFATSGLSSGESFFLEVDDGSGWTTISEWVMGTDFSNGTGYPNVEVELDPSVYGFSMTSNVSIRFRMSGNYKRDKLYLDDVKIEGYN